MRGKPIKIEGVFKRFGKAAALNGVSLEVGAGEFVALLGPSGCGKTTLLRIIAGLEDPEQGHLEVGDKVCFDHRTRTYLAPGKRDIGLIFQSYALWPHMTVRDNVLLAPRARGDKDAERNLDRLLADLKLGGLADRYPSQLSGGQQQRVAIGRMLISKPSVFLMDEPLSNLDAALRFEMRQELRRIHDSQDATTVYVTHDQGEALAMADRVAVMDQGNVVQLGPPADVYRSPATLQVARFLANPVVNVLDGMISGSTLSVGPFRAEAPAPFAHQGAAVVTVRPETVEVMRGEGSGPTLRVGLLMPLGAEAIATLEGEGFQLMARVPWETRPSVGERVRVGLPLPSMNVYHPGTGQRVGP